MRRISTFAIAAILVRSRGARIKVRVTYWYAESKMHQDATVIRVSRWKDRADINNEYGKLKLTAGPSLGIASSLRR